MKLTPQQLLMPMLLGFSLTGVSVILLYFLTRKDEDEATKRRQTRIETSRQSEIQLKVPRESLPAIIGRGGSVIKGIQRDTETQIKFQEESNIESPERICVIQGKPESIRLAEAMVLTIVKNQPVIETYEMSVPQKAIGRIMGKGGESIRQIQNTSSAKIIVDSFSGTNDPDFEKKLTIKGTTEQIASAVTLLEDKVREENEAREKLESSKRQPRSKISPKSNGKKEEDTESDEDSSVDETDAVKSDKPTNSCSELVTEPLPPGESTMEIYVSAMENPSQFWIQVYGAGTIALDELVEKMTIYYEKKDSRQIHALKKITTDQMVAAKFNYDERWYRSEVLSGPEDGEYEVFFVDFGDSAHVREEDILELRTDFLSLRLQAIECSLANVKPRNGKWSDKACDRFADLTSLAQWKRLFAKIKGYKERAVGCGRTRREGSPIPSIVIYDLIDSKEIDVGKELINEDLADPEEEVLSAASSTISLSKRNDFRKSPTPTSVSRKTPLQSEKNTKLIQEIDLTTPIKGNKLIEEIDLVSPPTRQSTNFLNNEKKSFVENGSGDHSRVNRDSKLRSPPRVFAAGDESDDSDDYDFE